MFQSHTQSVIHNSASSSTSKSIKGSSLSLKSINNIKCNSHKSYIRHMHATECNCAKLQYFFLFFREKLQYVLAAVKCNNYSFFLVIYLQKGYIKIIRMDLQLELLSFKSYLIYTMYTTIYNFLYVYY